MINEPENEFPDADNILEGDKFPVSNKITACDEIVDIKEANMPWRFYEFCKNHLCLLSFILTAILLETAYAIIGVFPFGSKDLLIVDLFHQYAPFLSELQDKLRSQSSLFYSWSGGLGTDFYATFSYYLASPFNILLLIFPKSWLTEAVLVLTLLKVGLSAAFFTVYLKEAYGRKDFSVVAFSIMYALSGYVLSYSWNIMWMDGILLMPLVILGLIRLTRDGRALMYTVAMGLLLFSNFYIAFFIVLFTVLYFPILMIQFLQQKNFRSILKKTSEVIIFSILALGLAAVMVLPTVFALRLTSASGEIFPRDIIQYFNLFDYLGRHLPLSEPIIREGLPNMYCGLAVLLLVPVFFLSSRFSRVEKVAYGGFIFLLIMSFNLNVLNFIWHGFHFPNQLPFRNALVYVFLIVTLASRAFEAKSEFSNRFWVVLSGLIAGLVLLTQKFNDKTPGFPDIYIVLLLIGIFAVVFTMRQEQGVDGNPVKFSIVFLIAVILEVGVSTGFVVDKVDGKEYYSTRNDYLAGDVVDVLLKQIKKIEKDENGFYRMEVMPPKTTNDPYLYNYNGVSIFSSMMPKKVVTTMQNLGLHSNGINSYKYEGSTMLLDSLLGVKYKIERTDKFNDAKKTPIFTKDKLSVYKNENAASIAYLAPKDMKNWSSRYSTPFAVQNNLAEKLSGVKDIFTSAKLESGTMTNASVTMSGANHFSVKRTIKSSESRLSIKVNDVEERYLYLYLRIGTNKFDSGYLMVGDKRIDFNARSSTLIDAGYIEQGKQVSVELVYKADADIDASFDLYADVMDEAKYRQAMNIVNNNSMKIEQFSDTYVKGSVTSEKDGTLFTTIPFHKGWSVKIDNKYVATFAIDNGFLGFDITSGKHTIELDYMTPYFLPGAGITVVCVILILAGMFRRIRYFS